MIGTPRLRWGPFKMVACGPNPPEIFSASAQRTLKLRHDAVKGPTGLCIAHCLEQPYCHTVMVSGTLGEPLFCLVLAPAWSSDEQVMGKRGKINEINGRRRFGEKSFEYVASSGEQVNLGFNSYLCKSALTFITFSFSFLTFRS